MEEYDFAFNYNEEEVGAEVSDNTTEQSLVIHIIANGVNEKYSKLYEFAYTPVNDDFVFDITPGDDPFVDALLTRWKIVKKAL